MLFVKYENYDSGDNFQYNHQTNASPHFRYEEREEPIIAGAWHHEWGPGIHTLLLAGRLIDENHFSDQSSDGHPLGSYLIHTDNTGVQTFHHADLSDFIYSGRFTIY